ncbi:unnamed protein product [Periconia digitata]|uniref:Calcineurin-like phosphoesterase domain-containing protein n=1 Tax=Periconia digitata TaxID=1303443 RepID=A0A9W4UQM9_9PLEO|nr:unnamed protein product [Periconia digitata]
MSKTPLILVALFGGALAAQPSAPDPVAAPLRELPWGQLNFLHTTDIHGWWGGHLQEASYSSDWGDYISFAKHLRDRADADGTDLILVDTGDRIEGNAIYDSSKPRGKFTYEIAKEQTIDLICSGNHELYKAESADGEFYHTVPDFKDNYLASNLDIINPETGGRQPLAQRYKKFTTKNQGIRILAFGFIFDFTGNDKNTFVQRVEDTVKEEWFREAIKDKEVDLILVYGHVDIRSQEYALLYSTIRDAHWDTPIQFFGGHSHIRDYHIFDSGSVALESGRYMETLGFMSISGITTSRHQNPNTNSKKRTLQFQRRYIDNNLFSMHHHSGKNATTFPTQHGLNVSLAIGSARKSLSLNHIYGCAPRDLFVSRRPYPHNESIFTWLETELLPQSIKSRDPSKKALVIMNTGGIRFDVFKGPFTKDTKFLVSPFTSGIAYLKDVPYTAAKRVIKLLNNAGPILSSTNDANATFLLPPEHVAAARYRPHLFDSSPTDPSEHPNQDGMLDFASVDLGTRQHQGNQQPLRDTHHHHASTEPPPLIPGYTTHDDAGSDGDDTIHAPIQFYNVPNCIQAAVGFSPASVSGSGSSSDSAGPDSWVDGAEMVDGDESEPEVVDIMYNEFIEKWVLLALAYLGESYSAEDSHLYEDGKSFTDIMTDWVEGHWGVDDVDDDGEAGCPS